MAPARKWPDRTAIDDGDASYTFAQLEQGAQAVAGLAGRAGGRPGDRVAVLAEKRAVMPLLAVAIWKCGGVYVPLDAAEPAARLRGLLTRLRPSVVIALDDRDPVVPAVQLLGGAQLAAILAGPAVTTPPWPVGRSSPRTSSSPPVRPASPKASRTVAAAPLRLFRATTTRYFASPPESRVLSLAPFYVDVSLEDTLLPLSLGAFVYQFRGLPAGAILRAVLAASGSRT